MMRRNSAKRGMRGQSLVEFTFVGIPMIFVLVSVFEISRGMWNYHTLAYAAKSGVRFAVVHGQNCDPLLHPAPALNSCLSTVANIAQVIQDAGVGLDIEETTVGFNTLYPDGTVKPGTITCKLRGASGGCQANSAQWPPNDGSNQKGSLIRIDVTTVFRSAIAMLWPGSRPVSFAVTNLAASSSDSMQF